ncbi:MAG: aspartate kinase [Chlamydiae bacterium GWC2_50_10]|nr:MAG: aspartate kinase [Chlamydiae bacterium GWA2_50_15]OGN54598.1 MAG: aspartate kinase [Chlamydiae bacterium GWC2_50_10]OGN57867.1 MAG: aspartate kinase [Chlamydiae bacterium RIFCSPHIGHO2_02_FULL_49_29]OGN63334.1 MAG: aspartate kinase [Chlamydiae bacterium RIFCSPHIGHO2_12_FULL_49_32]OGN71902.1 MAG: aspartate kinase [Chlamydiae bacterium RIFCSPLOWO2_02_FULL_49_12]OGN75161.1 MAG: aspartate kinase [Chlamydiae bacterium RIFCSPLOWO2_12_FULL_49_12]
MAALIMKFGGAAVETAQQFDQIASLILKKEKEYASIVAVVSAMGGMTDQLETLARQVHPNPPKREMDMLVSVGERVSIALLAMALAKRGREAISFTGSQSGIITTNDHSDARILAVHPVRLIPHLRAKKVVIVAGFQGMSKEKEITTLGRGGSDTTAVALGVALGADLVEYYKDVPGICTLDPKRVPTARVLPFLTYEEALTIVAQGAKILHGRAVRLAAKYQLPLYIRSFKEEREGTWIGERAKRERQGQEVCED